MKSGHGHGHFQLVLLRVVKQRIDICFLGTLSGSPQFVKQELEKIPTKHGSLIKEIPSIADLKAWHLQLFCAAPRLPPMFATEHVASVKW